MMHTGSTNFVRPSLGAWVLYGLGKETQELPGFISLSPPLGNPGVYGSAFLPAIYQGMRIGASKETEEAVSSDTVRDIANPMLTTALQRKQLDYIQAMNRDLLRATDGNDEVEAVIQSYATILASLGLNHEKLPYRYAGRDFRLTNVIGKVAKEVFA